MCTNIDNKTFGDLFYGVLVLFVSFGMFAFALLWSK